MEKKKGQLRKVSFWFITAVVLLCVGTAIFTASPIYRKSCRLRGGKHFGKYLDAKSPQYESKEFAKQAVMPAATTDLSIERKLIKRAELNLEVKNCEAVTKRILELVNSFSGLIIDSSIEKYPNDAKRGRAVLKILPRDFDRVISQLKELGKVDLVRITGEDVTEEYVDIGARLKNFYAVKERLLKILKDSARSVKDILEVERELSRLGEQIEKIEGRKKYLDRQVELATVTVNFYEPKAFSPEPLNIIKRFKQTIRTAIETFINVFNGVIVIIAAFLPLIIWVGVIFTIITVARRYLKNKTAKK